MSTPEEKSGDGDSAPSRGYEFHLLGGILFIAAGLCLFVLTGYLVWRVGTAGYSLHIRSIGPESSQLTQREIYNFYAGILEIAIGPVLAALAASVTTFIGASLLGSSGIISTPVVPPGDLPVIGSAISRGDDSAVTQYIRLKSLSGITGTFTKMGLTGLPLATIGLTVFLALMGIANPQFFDLAKLTLGAFLGSFVQRQTETAGRPLRRDGSPGAANL